MNWLKKHSTQVAAYSGLAVCIIFFTILTPIFGESIWSAEKIKTLMQNVIVLALMSVGAVFVYSLGSMDISIGRQVGLYATLVVIIGNATGSLLWGILLSLVISVIISAINGAAGEVLGIHPVISSLVFQMVISGVSSVIYNSIGSRNVALMNTFDVSLFRQTWFMILALVVEVLVVGYLFNFTKLARMPRPSAPTPPLPGRAVSIWCSTRCMPISSWAFAWCWPPCSRWATPPLPPTPPARALK